MILSRWISRENIYRGKTVYYDSGHEPSASFSLPNDDEIAVSEISECTCVGLCAAFAL